MHDQTPVSLTAIRRDQAPVLENLFELYCHDFSEHVPLELKPSGRFEVPLAEAWWTSDDHFPFLVHEDEKLVGFALARRGSRVTGAIEVMDVAEFFVIRGARGRGVGLRAAHALFANFVATWEIRVRPSNAPAQRFWSRVVHGWLGQPLAAEAVVVGGAHWNVLTVPARSAAGEPPKK